MYFSIFNRERGQMNVKVKMKVNVKMLHALC